MPETSYQNSDPKSQSLSLILRDIGASAKEVIQSEFNLFKIELTASIKKIATHSMALAAWGLILILSTIPFMAFLVIGLGKLLNDNYWLSSLITSLVIGVSAGSAAYSSFQKIKAEGIDMPHSKEGLSRQLQSITKKINDIKFAAKRRTV